MSIELVRDWLRAHPGREYSIQELGKHLKIRQSIFANCRTIVVSIKKGLETEIKYRTFEDQWGVWRGKVFYIEKRKNNGK